MKGFVETGNHNIEFLTYYEQGGGVEDYVAWCHTCDPKGENTIVSPVKNSYALARAVLFLKLATHLHSATKMRDVRGPNVRK